MMRRLLAVAALAATLAGCAELKALSDGQKAVVSTGIAITAIGDKTVPVLTKAQLSACASQDLANFLTALFTAKGQLKAARLSSDASKIFGYGCTWGQP